MAYARVASRWPDSDGHLPVGAGAGRRRARSEGPHDGRREGRPRPESGRPCQGRPGRDAHRQCRRHRDGRPQGRPHARRRRQPGGPEPHRDQLRLDAHHRLPGDVHAGRVRAGGDGTLPGEECQSHHDDELHGVRLRDVRLLGDGLRHPAGRVGRDHEPGRYAVRSTTSSRCRSSASTGDSSAPGDSSSPVRRTTSASW